MRAACCLPRLEVSVCNPPPHVYTQEGESSIAVRSPVLRKCRFNKTGKILLQFPTRNISDITCASRLRADTRGSVLHLSPLFQNAESFQLSLFLGAFRHDHAASPTSRIHHNPAQTMLPCPTITTTSLPFPRDTSRIPVPHHHSTLTMFHPHTTLSLATRPTTSHVLHTLSST